MSHAPLTRLGPYDIVERLGAGSMGEVYRATDSRLGRDVAIKILPPAVARDPSRRSRFEQEARAVAALNHPNILGLYDIGNEEETSYIVTEFVSGETLADLLERGPLPTRKLLDIAVQIADGMAAAHAARIAHRDLKPANIMVTTDGRVKILDFGLAKQTVVSDDPDATVAASHTEPGMILGTVNYMSPEQARGVATDYRSDQFSFGQILYEMAAGRRAFEKPESVQTMSAIISEDPLPIEQNIPDPLVWTIDRCLAKDPADRFESSKDLFQSLKSLRDHATETGSVQRPPTASTVRVKAASKRLRHWPLAAAFAIGLVAAFAFQLSRADTKMTNQSAYRFTPFSFAPGGQSGALWAPDGRSVAYAAREDRGPFQTYLRYLDSATPVRLTHTAEDATPLAWAPDGKRLLLSIDRAPEGIWSIATVGGEPEMVVPSVPKSRLIAISPDNQSVAYFYPGDDERYGVWISSPPTAAPKRYLPDPFATKDVYNLPKLKFSPDGKQLMLLFNAGRRHEESWVLPYPANASHPPHQVMSAIQSAGGTPTFCWMPDSRHVVMALASAGETIEQLWLADIATGKDHALTSGTASRQAPAVSPDGQRLIFRESTGSYDIVSLNLENASVHPYLTTERDEVMPSWSAGKPQMVYVTDRNGPQEIWLHSSEGDRPLVTARDFPGSSLQWLSGPALSPEGDRVVYSKVDLGDNGNRLWISAASGGTPVQLTNDHASAEFPGSWSPDGAWFTYIKFQDGKISLVKVKTSGQASPTVIKADVSYDNNAAPSFSPDGAWILLGETLYSVDGNTSKSLGEHHSEGYAFSPDGKRVYGLRPVDDDEELFAVDVATQTERVIGKIGQANRPRSNLNPAMHFTLTPDGKSMVYGVANFKDNLWMLEGFAPKAGLLARFGF